MDLTYDQKFIATVVDPRLVHQHLCSGCLRQNASSYPQNTQNASNYPTMHLELNAGTICLRIAHFLGEKTDLKAH